jgi:3-hydroxyacyl-CoA dehydrogenase
MTVTVGVVGAGTMGAGIAQVAVVAGHPVRIANTSSLSPTALAAGLQHPERLVGLHFFNPVPAMRLVEVISGLATDPAVADAAAGLAAAGDGCPEAAVGEAAGLLQAAGLDVYVIDDTPGLIVTRTVAMLANLAFDALAARVASEQDIDTAMRLGVNYPLGPLAWGRQWGTRTLVQILGRLDDWYRDGHYRASPLLRQAAAAEALRAPRRYAEKMPAGSGPSERMKESQ